MKLAWIVLVATAATAHADSAKIGEAKHALDEVRYDDAQRLLVAAIKEGGNSAAAMKEIYELSASAAVVLGQADAGEQYDRRWLALDPAAQLPDSVSPKLRAPFVAAQAAMAAKGAIAISASRIGDQVEVSVVSDPLAMVRGACPIASGATVPFDAQGRAHLATPDLRVAVCDESNNRLVEISVSVPAPVRLPPPAALGLIAVPEHHSWIARPSTWYLLGGVSVPASLILLGLTLQSGNDGSTSTGLVIATSITGGVAVASLITGTILLLGRDDPQLTATPTRGGAALSLVGRF